MRITLVVLLAVAPAVAVAQPAEPPRSADIVAAEAEALATDGKFVEAAARFREAYGIEARPDLLCNVGVAYHKAKDLPRAQLYLGQCLTQAGTLDAEFAAAVRNVLGVVDERLRAGEFAPVRVTVKPDNAWFTVSTFSPDERMIGSQLIWLPFGTHRIEVRAEGHDTSSATVEIRDRAEIAKTVVLERTVGGADVELPTPVSVRRSKRPAVIATIATGVVGAAGVGMFLWARSKASAAGKTDDTVEYNRLVDAAKSRQKISWVLGGVAVAGAAVSGYLWYRATRSETRVEVQPTAGGAAVTFTAPF